MNALITGCNGLVGSACVEFFCSKGWEVTGIDNDMRGKLFGRQASTRSIGKYLKETYDNFELIEEDVRNLPMLNSALHKKCFDLIIHAAAQPSHDKANEEPMLDFEINVKGTVNMLEILRKKNPEAVFIYMSTTKVYGDYLNEISFMEYDTRYQTDQLITEDMSISNGTHCIFGANKAAADIIAQEYQKFYGLNITILRCGCITGAKHKGTRMHGFLSYLAKCIKKGFKYTINGYKGKQVRDQLHVEDLVSAIYQIYLEPKKEIYNLGGGEDCNISILEAIYEFEKLTGNKIKTEIGKAREADHVWNVHDTTKFTMDYPEWKPRYDLDKILKDLL